MPVSTTCPHCRHAAALPDQLRGQKVRCARCQKVFLAAPTARPAAIATAAVAASFQRPERARSASAKSGVSHMTLFLGMMVAFLLAVIVVGAGAFWFLMQDRGAAPDTQVVSVPQPQPVAVPATEKKVVEEPPPVVKNPDPPPKEPTPAPMPTPTPTPVVIQAGDGSLSPEVLQRVKKSTVYLRVTLQDGGISQGSGFVGVEPNTIITNAHVLQMIRPLAPAPKQIEVIFNSGQADERKVPGTLLGVDRTVDLAVLKVAGAAPEPMPVRTAQDLTETQQVFVCGFPLGQRLGKEITIGNSRVASFRRDGGALTRVQLSGGMDPGNSGGPVIDTKGNVVGVAVSGVVGTTINFAIPGDSVHALLNGRLNRATFGYPLLDGKQVKVPATVEMLDPLTRVQKVGVEVWTGDDGGPRPSASAPPQPQPSDSARQATTLTYGKGQASGDVILPPLPEGKVYWFQLVYTSASGQSRWSQANVWQSTPAAERKPTTLPAAYKVGTQPLQVTSNLVLQIDRGSSELELGLGFQTSLQEQVQNVDNQGTATIRLQYEKMDAKITQNGQPPASNAFQQAAPFVNLVGADMRINRQGAVLLNQPDLAKLPNNPPVRGTLTSVADQIQQLVQAMSVPLSGAAVQPGQSWTAQRVLPIDTLGRYDNCVIDCQYTYIGVRTRDGKQEAVIDLAGVVKPRPGSGAQASGYARGTAIVDLASGLVVSVESAIDVDLSVPVNKTLFRAGGSLEMNLRRGP